MIKQLIQKIYLATTFWLLLPLQWWFFWLICIRYKSELRNSWYCTTSRIIQSLLQSKSKISQLDISIFLTFMDPSIIQESVTYIEDSFPIKHLDIFKMYEPLYNTRTNYKHWRFLKIFQNVFAVAHESKISAHKFSENRYKRILQKCFNQFFNCYHFFIGIF